jgi:hypothetical protein
MNKFFRDLIKGKLSLAASLRDRLRRHENRGRMSIDDERNRGPSRCPKRMHTTLIDFTGCALLFVVAPHLRLQPAGVNTSSRICPNADKTIRARASRHPASNWSRSVRRFSCSLSRSTARVSCSSAAFRNAALTSDFISVAFYGNAQHAPASFLLPPRWTIGGSANIAKLSKLVRRPVALIQGDGPQAKWALLYRRPARDRTTCQAPNAI